jgi:hypothetical protein
MAASDARDESGDWLKSMVMAIELPGSQNRTLCDCVAGMFCYSCGSNVKYVKHHLDSQSEASGLRVDAMHMFDEIIEQCNFEAVPECIKSCESLMTKDFGEVQPHIRFELGISI